jgi:RecB family endonuclease NucS
MFMVAPYVKLSLSVPQSDWSAAKNLLQIKLETTFMLHQIISVRRPLAFHPPVRGVLFHLVAM